MVRALEAHPVIYVIRMGEVEARQPTPPFFRIHRLNIVKLDRASGVRTRWEGEQKVKMDPHVDKAVYVTISRRSDAKLVDSGLST